jgi:hypothetical protein
MTREQKELLYKIADLHNKEFYNNMNDHWTAHNYIFDRKCAEKIAQLEKEYRNSYGDLPEWKYIDDVWQILKELKEELGVE